MKNKVQLITYANRLGDGTLASMTDILRTRFDGVYDGVHILPFFTPFDGADAGFDPIDHTKVDPRLGSWDDVAELSKTHNIMVDAIVNHMSWESKQFQDVLAKGEESEYYPMFLTMSSVFPNGATEEDLAGIYRPRPGLPFTHYKFAGKTRLVWVSFTPQQVDIDTDTMELRNASYLSAPEDIYNTLRWVALMGKKMRCDISASTGVHTANDVVKMLLAGATTVQVVSCLYKNGVEYLRELNDGLKHWMEAKGFDNLQQFRGRLAVATTDKASVAMRTQFMKYFAEIV